MQLDECLGKNPDTLNSSELQTEGVTYSGVVVTTPYVLSGNLTVETMNTKLNRLQFLDENRRGSAPTVADACQAILPGLQMVHHVSNDPRSRHSGGK